MMAVMMLYYTLSDAHVAPVKVADARTCDARQDATQRGRDLHALDFGLLSHSHKGTPSRTTTH